MEKKTKSKFVLAQRLIRMYVEVLGDNPELTSSQKLEVRQAVVRLAKEYGFGSSSFSHFLQNGLGRVEAGIKAIHIRKIVEKRIIGKSKIENHEQIQEASEEVEEESYEIGATVGSFSDY